MKFRFQIFSQKDGAFIFCTYVTTTKKGGFRINYTIALSYAALYFPGTPPIRLRMLQNYCSLDLGSIKNSCDDQWKCKNLVGLGGTTGFKEKSFSF